MTAPDSRNSHDGHTRDEHTREDSFELEVSALDTRQPLKRGPRPPWLRWAQIVSVVVVIAGVFWALVVPHPTPETDTTSRTTGMTTPVPRPYTISETAPGVMVYRFAGEPFTCPVAAAWSPDGQRFAILGYATCAMNSSGNFYEQDGYVAIFDASAPNAAPRAIFDLADQLRRLGLPPAEAQVAPDYAKLGWSPDGHSLAVTSNFGSGYGDVLLLPIDQAGVPARVLLAPTRSSATAPPATPPPGARYFLPAWNLVTGTFETIPLPLAAAYGWDGDTLVTTQPLGNASSGSGAVPGASVSLWQVGVLATANSKGDPAGPDNALALTLSTSGPVWSPDGMVLLPFGLGVLGRLDAPLPAALQHPGKGGAIFGALPSDAPTWPVHDAGLRAAIADLTKSQALLIWRPDGQRVVMAQPAAGVGGALFGYTLDVYDCASGKHLAHLAEPSDRTFSPTTQSAIWSPDGQHLLLLSDRDHTVTVFSTAGLGG